MPKLAWGVIQIFKALILTWSIKIHYLKLWCKVYEIDPFVYVFVYAQLNSNSSFISISPNRSLDGNLGRSLKSKIKTSNKVWTFRDINGQIIPLLKPEYLQNFSSFSRVTSTIDFRNFRNLDVWFWEWIEHRPEFCPSRKSRARTWHQFCPKIKLKNLLFVAPRDSKHKMLDPQTIR